MVRKTLNVLSVFVAGVLLGVILACSFGVAGPRIGPRWLVSVELDQEGSPFTRINWRELTSVRLTGKPEMAPVKADQMAE